MTENGLPGNLRVRPNVADLLGLLAIMAAAVIIATAGRHMLVPIPASEAGTIHLNPAWLPAYAVRTTLRMFAALAASLVFTFTYAVWAAKSRRAGQVLIPLLDILQSVPILGFLTFTVVFFLGLFPGRMMGAELAAIFTIFTSQAWNMAFAMYQALRTVPSDLEEAARCFGLTPWQRFWRLEVPFAVPSLVWNTMISMSGGWFMVVYSETITVGNTDIALPGIGSYVGLAIEQRDIWAIFYAIVTMLAVILAYDQLLFRPLVAWSARFRTDDGTTFSAPDPWVLTLLRRTHLLRQICLRVGDAMTRIGWLALGARPSAPRRTFVPARLVDTAWLTALGIFAASVGWKTWAYGSTHYTAAQVMQVIGLGGFTLLRVTVTVLVSTLVWVPIGIWLGLSPQRARRAQMAAQFMAAFPANLFFPLIVVVIVHQHLNSNIWLTPLMLLGTQWYILFNIVAGASSYPGDLLEAARNFHVSGWLWWRRVMLPGIAPYFITGALTASGGAWNAAIATEVASWGDTTLSARGLGAYIAHATVAGATDQVGLGMVVMAAFVLLLNRALWRPLSNYAARHYTFD
ncbi:ABC transporter permease subunit [Komagataeibacter sp. FNDCR2]|uniref:ABC transporter permease n=1 Tax=Komagataeibacter sp. FNDCR2 TaxID=2878682 RepID=UPI001E6234B1|nr:ABC transporter permease subunit [Komagataeibacter sp. FNDCR2]